MSPQRSRLLLKWLRYVSSPEGSPWTRQGTIRLSSYLYHQHSEVLLNGVLAFEANDGTRQCTEPLVMTLSAPHVQSPFIIRCCPRQKRLRGLVHVPTREHAFPKPCMLSMTKTCHPYIRGNRQKDDQFK